MPSVEITPEQAAALARGENISLAPPAPKGSKFVVTNTRNGKITLVEGAVRNGGGLASVAPGKATYTLLRHPARPGAVKGTPMRLPAGRWYDAIQNVITEVGG